jgi:hypothetical protein
MIVIVAAVAATAVVMEEVAVSRMGFNGSPFLSTLKASRSVRHSAERLGDLRCHQRRANSTTNHGAEPQVNSYPANERKIWEVERGRICNAILPIPTGKTLSVGDSILFALAYSPVGQETCYVKGGDSVSVFLTDVTDLGAIDPATGKALFRLSWKPPGQSEPPDPIAKRDVKSRGSHWKG